MQYYNLLISDQISSEGLFPPSFCARKASSYISYFILVNIYKGIYLVRCRNGLMHYGHFVTSKMIVRNEAVPFHLFLTYCMLVASYY